LPWHAIAQTSSMRCWKTAHCMSRKRWGARLFYRRSHHRFCPLIVPKLSRGWFLISKSSLILVFDTTRSSVLWKLEVI
jgi:hypothetical protein